VPDTKLGQKRQRIIKHFRDNLFVATNCDILPTINGAEHISRACVVFQKVTSCFWIHSGAQLYGNISSVVVAAGRSSISVLRAIRFTLDSVPRTQATKHRGATRRE
jgi:hypothetical protein